MNSSEVPKNPRDRLIVALDFADASQATDLVCDLARDVSTFKIGLQLFTAAGPEIVRAVKAAGGQVFLDLKLHDIPNTVGKAVAAAAEVGVRMLTLHLSGGRAMIEAAVAEAPPDLLLLGVTVLTSSDEATLREVGIESNVEEQAIRLAQLGAAAGVQGLISSPREVATLRSHVNQKLIIITPGVRPSGTAPNDQKRFTTPRAALQAGADYLVVGRPITDDPEPCEAVQRILDELGK